MLGSLWFFTLNRSTVSEDRLVTMLEMHANDFDFDLKVRKLILETTEKKSRKRTILAGAQKIQLTFQSKDGNQN